MDDRHFDRLYMSYRRTESSARGFHGSGCYRDLVTPVPFDELLNRALCFKKSAGEDFLSPVPRLKIVLQFVSSRLPARLT